MLDSTGDPASDRGNSVGAHWRDALGKMKGHVAQALKTLASDRPEAVPDAAGALYAAAALLPQPVDDELPVLDDFAAMRSAPSTLPSTALLQMTLLLQAARRLLNAETFQRLRALLTGGRITLHRGETVMTVTHAIDARLGELLPQGWYLVTTSDLGEGDWRAAFAAFDRADEAPKSGRAR